jgi:hypothetical protein
LSDLAALAEGDLKRLESSTLFVSGLIKSQGAQGGASKLRIPTECELRKSPNDQSVRE